MIVVLKPDISDELIDEVEQHVIELGYEPRLIKGVQRTVIAAVGDETCHRSLELLRGMDVVENVVPIQKRYKLASREFHSANSTVNIGSSPIGKNHFQIIGGPCAVESREQLHQVAKDLTACGIKIIRGGAYKPRTSPYDFQGLGEEGLDLLQEIKDEYGVSVVTEVVAVTHVEKVAAVADMMQIGARNCQNYHLLEVVAGCGKPVLLKRGMASNIEEWLSAAEYLMVNGCENVILCERGIRTFETATRNTLDLSAVALAKQESHLPVVVDPSHAAGVVGLVPALSRAAVAAGA
ncbi:MAG TPA: 3-deoxy-7-phosphoheptulonate synthase, partial [Bacteroidales bacterium]|nr:3-deoxy-7-phosphoheptulonate synthase [Bacteroidales bacterium]